MVFKTLEESSGGVCGRIGNTTSALGHPVKIAEGKVAIHFFRYLYDLRTWFTGCFYLRDRFADNVSK